MAPNTQLYKHNYKGKDRSPEKTALIFYQCPISAHVGITYLACHTGTTHGHAMCYIVELIALTVFACFICMGKWGLCNVKCMFMCVCGGRGGG